MQTEDQSETIALLARAETHGGAREVERIDTHISVVFLAGDRAIKLKRAVKYPYLDFSTPEIRRRMCEREVAINRRTAPDIYLDAVPVTREVDGSLALDGSGEPVDWVVRMRRFDPATLYDRLAEEGALDAERMRALAARIAEFHEAAERRPDTDFAGNLRGAIETNRAAFHDDVPDSVADPDEVDRLFDATLEVLDRIVPLLDERRAAGFVRHCHGDLHLRNIFEQDGVPTLFDAIEFDDALAEIDVLYDLAFLLMDLEHRGLRPLGNAVLNAYLEATHDYEGLAALPVFLSFRANIRALVTATAAGLGDQAEGEKADAKRREARDYLNLARTLLDPPPAWVVAVGGLPGSGKTTVARGLAPELGAAPGAVVVRSDVTRKELAGVEPTNRLPEQAYTPEATERVYRTVFERAAKVAAAGHGAIADAVFGEGWQRRAIAEAAARAGADFEGLWLEAPVEERAERAERRGPDASDADAAFIRRKTKGRGPAAPRGWHTIDADGDPEAVTAAALEALDEEE